MPRKSDLARRTLLSVLILTAAVVLHGCSGAYNTAGSNVSLEQDEEQAVVVLSVRTNAYKLTDITMNWREYDPAIGFFKDSPAGAFSAGRHYGYLGVESSSPMQKAEYLVYKVKSGYYALDSNKVRTYKLSYNIKLRPTTLMFRVKPGEVLYIGDYLLHSPKTVRDTLLVRNFVIYDYRNTKLQFEGRNDDAVKAALAENYSNLEGPVVFRKPAKVEMKLP